MGASQSAHKLTVTNEDEGEGVIQVSNAIVQRLKQGLQETSSVPEDVRVQSQRAKPATPEGGAAPLPPGGVPPSGYPSYYYPEYTISAIEMQRQKEAELDQQDEYWKKRVLNLEKKHEQINNILECEYKKAIAEFTDGKFILFIIHFIYYSFDLLFILLFPVTGLGPCWYKFMCTKNPGCLLT